MNYVVLILDVGRPEISEFWLDQSGGNKDQ